MATVTARIGGIEICYEEFGDPQHPAILLIMGLGGPMFWWEDEFCSALADRGFRVIRYDNRDVGLSRPGASPARVVPAYLRRAAPEYSLEDMAADAAGLLRHLQVPRAHVVGVSMGGMIAQLLAIRHPALVRSLTSMMSTTGSRKVGWINPRVLARMFRKIPDGEEAYVARNLEGFRRIGSPRYFESNLERQRARAHRTFAYGLNPAGTMRQLAAIVNAADRTSELANIRVPTTVLHGTADPLVHVSGGKATARAIPGAELVLVPGMGHDMPRELWPVLLDAIERTARRAY
ncbi:alpha/beta hydrolase [Sporichthya sp.]|uniref:alpha/beta fold hydrolase n=1 Tax=Sporichthya sp. TaxID=65475 RepID=UPI0017A8DAF1|nr:alpha/beta hydrolase [Sporichthya sp.]MBA3742238.1 alpha/beta hydrolase [Sporichthya sp.]